ncbi:MAG TPA: RNA polymerase sigma factor [Flavilitoribacter sp.]|nr:RNA polymerase sigma factor [Lewinellaceae bacterium]HMQ60989.1 RNA polymerase sigma factor [Flavilitoribacter sp.]HMQ88045.1 RNA polymerase sigma factor [Flavilitoribacter sp.]
MPTTLSMTEAEIIEGCLANDRLAQKALYDRYSQAMYTIAYRITNDFDLASDVLQEGFLKAFRALPKFRKESTLGAWLKTIIIRTAISRMKREPSFEELPSAASEDWVDWGDFMTAEYLEKAIQSLPEGYRAVFVLIEVEGYSHQETADMLGISPGTSKSQLFHAKKRLRRILSEWLDV